MADFRRTKHHSLSSERWLTLAIFLMMAWYIFLCFLHLLSRRPLWNDEECVFRSIAAFSPTDFFHKWLLAIQMFPRVYLFLIQQIAKPFHFSLVMLRLPSFVCMMAGFFCWMKIASCELKNKLHYLTFCLSWAGSAVLIYYSAELKPYSMDVLVASIFILFLYHQEKLEKDGGKKYATLLFILPALVLFSYPAYFFVALPLYNLFCWSRKDPKRLRSLAIYAGSLILFAGLSYFFDIRLRPVKELTQGWNDYFVSLSSVGEFLKTSGEGTMNLLSRWFVERPKILKHIGIFFVMPFFLKMLVTFPKNFRNENFQIKSIHTIAFIVFAELFLLGVMKKYPFTVPRTSLFFCPLLFLLVVKGIAGLKDWNKKFYGIILGSFIYFLIFLSIGISFFVFAKQLMYRPVLW